MDYVVLCSRFGARERARRGERRERDPFKSQVGEGELPTEELKTAKLVAVGPQCASKMFLEAFASSLRLYVSFRWLRKG